MSDPAYRVLARKYRPVDFDGLIGQEVLVRTLSNAIAAGRLAQAYVLTGVRGVGKTTTARILARAFNCVGPDGQGGPTVKPCGVCEHCLAIAEDRHVDVMEMDAASNNSVDNIREIVEASRYRPSSARYKIYILDEVHMLSNAAFNALLKTLEEPPPHLKFIFATTEIRKVPVTVLSRCQRFDLRRVEVAELADHFAKIAEQEDVAVEPSALTLVSRAADGSVRDGLSLLDQAIALSDGKVTEEQVRDMLGLADRGVIFDLAEALLAGDVPAALAVVGRMHASGADPAVILGDLLELTHWLTRLKIDPNAANDALMPEAERSRGAVMAEPLSLPVLARLWQLLLKGVGELNQAPTPRLALEMVLIRTAYAANLPAPADLVRQLQDSGAAPPSGNAPRSPVSSAPSAPPPPSSAPPTPQAVGAMPVPASDFRPPDPPPHPAPPPMPARAEQPVSTPPSPEPSSPEPLAMPGRPRPSAPSKDLSPPASFDEQAPDMDAALFDDGAYGEPVFDTGPDDAVLETLPVPSGFRELVGLLEQRRIEPLLTARLRTQVRPVSFETGQIVLALEPGADGDMITALRRVLQRLFGGEWQVNRAPSADTSTIAELEVAEEAAEREQVLAHPLVQAALEQFPGATVGEIRKLALSQAADDWIAGEPMSGDGDTFEDKDDD